MQTADSLSLAAYHGLEAMLVTQELAPGTLVSEAQLGERLGMGRTPIREAIQRLAWEGLLLIRPRHGILVTPIDPTDFSRVLAARYSLELLLTGAAAQNADDSARAALAACANEMTEAAETGQVRLYLALDKRFDEIVAAAAGNVFAARVVAPLQTLSRRFWFCYFANHDLQPAAKQHVALMRHISDGKVTEARQEAARLIAHLQMQAEFIGDAGSAPTSPTFGP
jgi:DNA-binding GntR family transcriptional regulator